jgi:hypothetical protein
VDVFKTLQIWTKLKSGDGMTDEEVEYGIKVFSELTELFEEMGDLFVAPYFRNMREVLKGFERSRNTRNLGDTENQ